MGRAHVAVAVRRGRRGHAARSSTTAAEPRSGGGILVGYPFPPHAPASFNGPLPGMDVAVLDATGKPVVGEIGELAVLNTWPGMTHALLAGHRPLSEHLLETVGRTSGSTATWPSVDADGDLADPRSLRRHDEGRPAAASAPRRSRPRCSRTPGIAEAAVIGVPGRDNAASGSSRSWSSRDGRRRRTISIATARPQRRHGRSRPPSIVVSAPAEDQERQDHAPRDPRAHLGEPTGDLSALDPHDTARRHPDPAELGEHA